MDTKDLNRLQVSFSTAARISKLSLATSLIVINDKYEMKRIRHISTIVTIMLTFLACGNKPRQEEPIIYDNQTEVGLSDSSNIQDSVYEEDPLVEEKSSTSVRFSSSSSSHSFSIGSYDNMRG